MYIIVRYQVKTNIPVEFVGPFDCQDRAERDACNRWGGTEEAYFWEVVSLTSPR